MKSPTIQNVSVYGIGNFGYAILKHLDKKQSSGITLRAYDRKPDLMKSLSTNRQHLLFHKSVKISSYTRFTSSPADLIANCDLLVLTVSSDATREVLQKIKLHIKHPIIIVNTAKALDFRTGRRISEIVKEELSGVDYTYALLAGGTIAHDLFRHEPLGVDLACEEKSVLGTISGVLESDNLSVYPTTDLVGLEYAAAFKNVVAILAGIVKGLGLSYGAETHVISRTAYMLGRVFVSEYGSQPGTFDTGAQCWSNDLWMSCTGNTRNREFGILVGKGMPVAEAIDTMSRANKTVEGINTLKVLDKMPAILAIEPIGLLHKLVIAGTIDIMDAKEYFIKAKLAT